MLEGQSNDSMATQHPKNPSTAQATNNSAYRSGVSARKLAATLWELQEISLSGSTLPSKVTNDGSHLHPPDTPSGKRTKQPLSFPPSPASAHVTMRALRRSTIKCRFADGAKRKPATTGQNAATTTHMQVLKLLERARPIEAPQEEEETHEIEVDHGATTTMPAYHDDKPVPNANGTSTTSSELLKVLNRVWSLEEQHKSSISVVNSLQSDLEGARSQVKDLTIQQVSHKRDMEILIKQLSDERSQLQEREKEKAMNALQIIREELEEEKKGKRKIDLAHRKVNKELIDVKKSMMKALQDLERERKARELMEDVCDELAREVGEDKARVEELKRESIKVREEVEEERKMLQVAEVWREERVQMKLAEARLEIEEKNTALDKLRTELDAFLKAKRASMGATQDLASAIKANPKPEVGKTQVVGNEQQSSTTLNSLLKEAYVVNDEHQITDKASTDVEITGTAQKGELLNDKSAFADDDEEDEEEDEEGLDYIELNKGSYVRGVEAIQAEKMKGVNWVDNFDSTSPVHKVHSYLVENVIRQGVWNANGTQAEAMGMMGENKDKVKTWSFKLDMPWSTDTMVAEKISSEDVNGARTYEPKSTMKGDRYASFTQDEREGSVYEPQCNMKGDRYSPFTQDEREGSVYEPQCNIRGERYISLAQEEQGGKATIQNPERGALEFSESISSMDGNVKLCESSSSNTEAASIGVWSLQNLGNSTRDAKGTSSLSQSESPTQRWDYNMPSPGLERPQEALNSRPAKAAMVGSLKPSKDSIVKGKLAETKTESRQPRFRFGRA